MAGIGFELKRVIEKGGVLSFLKAAFSGIMIVAGPWLISIVSIYSIGKLIVFLPALERQIFIAAVIYSFAFSLMFFGGIHFIFIRLMADFIYEKKPETASSLLIFFTLVVGLASAAVGGAVTAISGIETEHTLLLIASGAVLFGSVNCIWIVMLFVSLLKWYGRILLAYIGGMGAAVGLMVLLAKRFGIAGALAGFAAGQFLIFLALLILSLRDYPPGKFGEGREWVLPYIKKHRALFVTGQLYPLAIWGDKVLFWFLAGERIGSTIFRLFPSYDVAVYIGTLTMIPGLVYFIIGVEPDVYVRIKRFLLVLNIGKLREIQLRKYEMLRYLRLAVNRITVFGGIIALVFMLLTPQLIRLFETSAAWNHLLLCFAAVFAHFCFLVCMNVLFYLNFYRHTCTGALLFFLINCAVSTGIGISGYTEAAGAGYLAGAAAAALYSYRMLLRDGRKIDRYILSGAAS